MCLENRARLLAGGSKDEPGDSSWLKPRLLIKRQKSKRLAALYAANVCPLLARSTAVDPR